MADMGLRFVLRFPPKSKMTFMLHVRNLGTGAQLFGFPATVENEVGTYGRCPRVL
jgi:hypothetical protein